MSQSHQIHDEFSREHPPGTLEYEPRAQAGYFQLNNEELEWFEGRGCQWIKVPVGKGALVLWDNRTIHSTCGPFRGRQDPKPRFLLYGTLAPASAIAPGMVDKWASPPAKNQGQEAKEAAHDDPKKSSCGGPAPAVNWAVDALMLGGGGMIWL